MKSPVLKSHLKKGLYDMSGVAKSVIAVMYREGQQSIPQIACHLGVSKSSIRDVLISEGVEMRSRTEGIRLRKDHLSDVRTGLVRKFTPEWRENISKGMLAHGEKHAKGTSKKATGYIEHTRGHIRDGPFMWWRWRKGSADT